MKGISRISRSLSLLLAFGTVSFAQTREELVGNLRQHHEKLRSASRNMLLHGDFLNSTARVSHSFQAFADFEGMAFENRRFDANSEMQPGQESIRILTPAEAFHLLRTAPEQAPLVIRSKPDGTGAYTAMRTTFTNDMLSYADACWKFHDVDVVAFLEDPKLFISSIEKVEIDAIPVVRVRFEADGTAIPFDRGELRFRPDLDWSLTFVECRFPISATHPEETVHQWTIEPARWTDGKVFPSRVEQYVRSTNSHNEARTHVAFDERSSDFERDRLLNPATWLDADAANPSLAAETELVRQETIEPEPIMPRLPPGRASRIMKIASPLSGMLSVAIVASFVGRHRRRPAH